MAELTAALTDDHDELREPAGEMEEWIGELEEISRDTERLGRQRTTIRELTRLGSDQKAHRDLTVEFSSFLSDQLFWRKSSPPVDAGFFLSLGASAEAWLSAEGAREIGTALKAVLRRPIGVAMTILVLAGLLAVRHRLRKSIRESGRRIRRISTDRMRHTLLGLLATLAHALPLPLAMGALSLGLVGEPAPGPWVRGTARWLGWAAWMLMWILPLRAMAAEGGISREHFGWDPEACDALRRALKRLTLVYLPPVFVASVTFYDRLPQAFDSLGRLAFVAGQAGLIWPW